MRELGEHLRNHTEDYRAAVQQRLFERVWQSRQVFALSSAQTHLDLAPAIAWVLEKSDGQGTVPPEVLERLSLLGRQHRRFGFPPEIYSEFQDCLIDGLEVLALTSYQHDIAQRVITTICQTMAESAASADSKGIPAAHAARVVAVARPNRHTAVIRLESSEALHYKPGQSYSVNSAYLPGVWRLLTPGIPADPTGQLIFHLSVCGDASRSLAGSQPGDFWTLGNPQGDFLPHHPQRVVFFCFGTGWAAVRAFLLSLVEAGNKVPCTVFAVADSPGEHYDTEFQANLRALAPWINLRLLVREKDDPWLLGAQPAAEATHFELAADPVDVLLAQRPHNSHTIVVVGPGAEVDGAKERLVAGGVSESDIETHGWSDGREWDPQFREEWEAWRAWTRTWTQP
ncbi:2-polyprenylphenol hydroxylase [Corynebacterium flavescens]|uniref:2-polyprenylphenol hydroxylase n=1 Tax=Corynebacterium flavescens TaxID=28028 RepID=UPI003FD26ED3